MSRGNYFCFEHLKRTTGSSASCYDGDAAICSWIFYLDELLDRQQQQFPFKASVLLIMAKKGKKMELLNMAGFLFFTKQQVLFASDDESFEK